MRMIITFSPLWFRRFGLDFSEPSWRDPIARTELDRAMRRVLHEVFGDVGLGEKDPLPRPNIHRYGHRFMAAFWGCEILYQADQEPAAIPLEDPAEAMAELDLPDFDHSPVVRDALAEARRLEDRYGSCDANINWGGPLNNAVSVLGEEMLLALAAEPNLASRTLQLMAEAPVGVFDRVTRPIAHLPQAPRRPMGGIGNCPVCMISPETYQQVVLPVDLWFSQQIENCGLHHCGAFHPYAEVYKPLKPSALQIGYASDRRLSRAAYPNVPMSLMLEASALVGKTVPQIRHLVRTMVDEAAPAELITDICVVDAGPEVSDQVVRELMTCCELEGSHD